MKYVDIREADERTKSEFWNLYESAFPANERRTSDLFAETLLSPEFCPMCVFDDAGEFCGLICIWQFEKYVYGEHLATVPEKRNCGLGAKIFAETMEKVVGERRFVFEVEKPETPIAIRRIEFYKRLGCVMNDFYYVQPPYSLDSEGLELLIMSYPSGLSRAKYEEFLDSVYPRAYALAFRFYDLNIVINRMKKVLEDGNR